MKKALLLLSTATALAMLSVIALRWQTLRESERFYSTEEKGPATLLHFEVERAEFIAYRYAPTATNGPESAVHITLGNKVLRLAERNPGNTAREFEVAIDEASQDSTTTNHLLTYLQSFNPDGKGENQLHESILELSVDGVKQKHKRMGTLLEVTSD